MSLRCAVLAALVLAGCERPAVVPVAAVPQPGISLALYRRHAVADDDREAYAVIDDRRWVEVADGALVVNGVAPDAQLQSMTIEPLLGALTIGTCEALTNLLSALDVPPGLRPPRALRVRCRTDAAPGRYLVRLLYVSSAIGYHAEHAVAVTAADRASVRSRFAVEVPDWGRRADLAVFDGIPGSESPPRELVHGSVMLDGRRAELMAPPREAAAQLRWSYQGAVHADDEPGSHEPSWGKSSQAAVWVWLSLDAPLPAPGPVRVHLAVDGEPIRDVEVAATALRGDAVSTRLPLWADPQLHGKRERWSDPGDAPIAESFIVTLTNAGDADRDVWIEEPLRLGRASIVRAWPNRPTIARRVLRVPLSVPAGQQARASFEVRYEH